MAEKEKFDINDPENIAFALRIAKRAGAFTGLEPIDHLLDIKTVKNDIDWLALLMAEDRAFIHDMAGINRHLDRDTGELKDFLPIFHI